MGVELKRYFETGSSPVDWCEPNYAKSTQIAEFYNTFSNFIYLIGPPLLVHLHADYAQWISKSIDIVWWFFTIVGISSAYFHATLSLFGQLVDELSILWTFMIAIASFCPRRYLPEQFKDRRDKFSLCIGVITVILTVLSVFEPAINAFALMFLIVPVVSVLNYNFLVNGSNQRVNNLIKRTLIMLGIAVMVWINDRLCCDFWTELNFAYLHAIWHILIFISSYGLCVLAAWAYALEEKPEWKPRIKYWPNDMFEMGVPYVAIKTPDHGS